MTGEGVGVEGGAGVEDLVEEGAGGVEMTLGVYECRRVYVEETQGH